ncbi:TPA: multifunctional oxoglutarate decarboxylase/oxoglutarate dehydrogenase thiamine pyrophosphate-binding subunit/dihydrolipoyllysine-residue succinyltransferase subunit, partial [Corynebacterium striatum]|nr:multifunctional oxoglutarate decarboxylase/oxoglutarate dehydrogenase thiamine pyrophosphate-binding subunit/dihydrolipoyllysine-residue succinyltransferase subunit [Corynebacterium striatum]
MRRIPAVSNSSIFGPNAWLIDEQFQQYSKDPNSVDKEWRDYFEANGAPNNGASTPAAASADKSAKKSAPVKPAAKSAAAGGAPAAKPAKVAEKPGKDSNSKKKTSESPLDRISEAPEAGERQLKGMFKAIAKNMDESLEVPTATTVRDVPVKLMWENRAMINDHLKRTRGGKISFTHILGYALVKATQIHPDMNVRYELKDGKPTVVQPEHINLGLAIDLPQKDGSRALVVAAVKEAENMSFSEFVDAYQDIVNRSRKNKLTMDDFSGVTINLTNPGGIGTRHSIARLTKGAGAIIGVGSMDYPAEFAGTSEDRLADLGVGRLVTLTSTYDHRVIQGAESGEFLRTLGQLIVDDRFWDELFESMGVPYQPFRWAQDVPNTGVDKNTRVMQYIESYRSRGHLLADVNPLGWRQPGLPWPDHRDLDLKTHGLTIWDLDRTFNVGGFGGQETMTLREVVKRLRDAYTLKVGSEYAHILDRDERSWLQDRLEAGMPK